MHPAEDRWQDALAAHAVDETTRHQHVDQGRVRHREHGDDAEHAEREPGRAGSDDRSEEHTSELQSLMRNSYAVFCLKKKKTQNTLQESRQLINKYTK